MARGGRRVGAGRPKGTANLATTLDRKELAEKARSYADRALNSLLEVAENGSNETARVSAASTLLDRGYGKSLKEAAISLAAPDNSLADIIAEINSSNSRAPIRTQNFKSDEEVEP